MRKWWKKQTSKSKNKDLKRQISTNTNKDKPALLDVNDCKVVGTDVGRRVFRDDDFRLWRRWSRKCPEECNMACSRSCNKHFRGKTSGGERFYDVPLVLDTGTVFTVTEDDIYKGLKQGLKQGLKPVLTENLEVGMFGDVVVDPENKRKNTIKKAVLASKYGQWNALPGKENLYKYVLNIVIKAAMNQPGVLDNCKTRCSEKCDPTVTRARLQQLDKKIPGYNHKIEKKAFQEFKENYRSKVKNALDIINEEAMEAKKKMERAEEVLEEEKKKLITLAQYENVTTSELIRLWWDGNDYGQLPELDDRDKWPYLKRVMEKELDTAAVVQPQPLRTRPGARGGRKTRKRRRKRRKRTKRRRKSHRRRLRRSRRRKSRCRR